MESLVVILAILLVAGAFMWLQPSARDKYLAKLRTDALTNGFLIGSIRLPDNSEHGRVNSIYRIETLYQLAVEFEDENDLSFTVARTSGESGVFLPDGWSWAHRAGMPKTFYDEIAALLVQLPEAVDALVVKKGAVGLVWDEKSPEVSLDWIKSKLKALAQVCSLQLKTA